MNVSNMQNNYQILNAYQRPVVPEKPIVEPPSEVKPPVEKPPVERPTTEYSPGEVYKASDGNIIADRDGNLSLTPQGKLNVENAKQERADAAAAEVQEKRDNLRGFVVDYAAHQSKKTQVEIYLAVATQNSDIDININHNSINILESLRETQKQNNIVQAYAQYQENQENK